MLMVNDTDNPLINASRNIDVAFKVLIAIRDKFQMVIIDVLKFLITHLTNMFVRDL